MIDTIVSAANYAAPVIAGVNWSVVLSSAGVTGLVGKIIWDWLKSPRHSCLMHQDLSNEIAGIKSHVFELKTDIAVMNNNINWLIEDYKKRNGVRL